MIECGKCQKETLPFYITQDGKSLCVECATKHCELVHTKMNRDIQEMQKSMNNSSNDLFKLKRQMCKHENLIDTGYCRWSDRLRLIFKCAECGKEILKD